MRKKHKCLTQERLKELLDYDPLTGIFRWNIERQGPARIGDIAGTPHNRGYINIRIDGRAYAAHRLAFLWTDGSFPQEDTDHINGIRNDNRWVNLRECSVSLNLQNQKKAHADSNSGLLGAYRSSPGNISRPWKSEIYVEGKRRHLGLFATAEEAHEAYLQAKRELHEGCTI